MSSNLPLHGNGNATPNFPFTTGVTTVSWNKLASGTGGLAANYDVYEMYDDNNSQGMWITQGHSSADQLAYCIKRDTSNNEWSDAGNLAATYNDKPDHFLISGSITPPAFASASTNPQTANSNDKYLHFWRSNGGYLGYTDVWTPFNSSGPNTLSGGTSQEIKDIHMYKLSDTSVSYSFNWQNVNSAYVWVNNAMHTISLGGAGNSGHHSSTLTGLTDGDIIIISNTDFKYIHRFVEWSKLTWGNTTSVVAETFGETGFEFRIQNTLGENSQYVSYQNSNQFAITANQTSSKKVYWQVWKHRASPFHMSKYGESFSTGSSSLHRNFW